MLNGRDQRKGKGKGDGGKGEHESKGGFGSKGRQRETRTMKDKVEEEHEERIRVAPNTEARWLRHPDRVGPGKERRRKERKESNSAMRKRTRF